MMSEKKTNRPSLDMLNMNTIDLTFSEPTLPKTQKQPQMPTTGTGKIKLTEPTKQGKAQNPWWHMGTSQYHNKLKQEDPNDFSWALRKGPVKGGLDFGLKISGSTMPCSGRKRIFY